MPIKRILKPLASLRLTIVCLSLGLILVFVGTLAQVHWGLYEVQSKFFRSFFIYWTPSGSHWRIPVFPGGWLIGGVLLANLIAGHATRFELSRKKIGIWLAHLGLIVLLAGQFLTEAFQQESFLRIEVGQTKNFTEDARKIELAVIDTTAADHDNVVSIPGSMLSGQGEIRPAQLPFAVRVKGYLPNSLPTKPGGGEAGALSASQGIGRQLSFAPVPVTAAMDSENRPAALLQIVTEKGLLGEWLVSTWLTQHPSVSRVQEWLGDGGDVSQPQTFAVNGHTYQLALRPVRYYKPYSLTLQEFRHDVYLGTAIPKNFSSRIHLTDPARGENRDVLIYMNNPLRYGGETFYQSSFEPGDRVSVLQVVRNPASTAPYAACILVTLGLVVQFLMHLFEFSRRRARQGAVPIGKGASAAASKEAGL